jgi:hypothetical protein
MCAPRSLHGPSPSRTLIQIQVQLPSRPTNDKVPFNNTVEMPHCQVSDYIKTDIIAMSYLTCLGEIFPWSCHKVTYSWRKLTEMCPNDRVALIDRCMPVVWWDQNRMMITPEVCLWCQIELDGKLRMWCGSGTAWPPTAPPVWDRNKMWIAPVACWDIELDNKLCLQCGIEQLCLNWGLVVAQCT